MVAPSSRRTTRAARTSAGSSRGREKKKKVLVNAPAKKWFRVQRAPSQDCGFLVWKWKTFDDLTEEEKAQIFPQTESEVATPSSKNDFSTPGTDESLLSQSMHETPASHAGLPTPSRVVLSSHEMKHEEITTPMLQSPAVADPVAGEPPAKRARFANDSEEKDAPHHESSTDLGVSSQPFASEEQEQHAEKAIPMDTEQILPENPETSTQAAASDTSMDIENESGSSTFPTETTGQTIVYSVPAELEAGTADVEIVASAVDQTSSMQEEALPVSSPSGAELPTISEPEVGAESDLKQQAEPENSGSISATRTQLTPADQTTIPSNNDLSVIVDTTTASQLQDTETTEAHNTETAQSEIAKQHSAEDEAAAALSSLADIFASEPTVPEHS